MKQSYYWYSKCGKCDHYCEGAGKRFGIPFLCQTVERLEQARTAFEEAIAYLPTDARPRERMREIIRECCGKPESKCRCSRAWHRQGAWFAPRKSLKKGQGVWFAPRKW